MMGKVIVVYLSDARRVLFERLLSRGAVIHEMNSAASTFESKLSLLKFFQKMFTEIILNLSFVQIRKHSFQFVF